ncbi:membrane protein [Xylella taiwanensis]|nr:membrane protein [Xylella taiwanensis]
MERVLNYADLRKVLTRLSPGNEIAFDISNDGQLCGMRFNRDENYRIELTLGNNTIHEQVSKRQTSTRTVVASGEIKSSLWMAAREAGLSPTDVITLTDKIFKYDIDFDKDLQTGDRFSVAMEETWREGERLPGAKILAATFNTGGKIYSALRFMRDGKAEYFDMDGRPLKKSFIRMPISYARLSSTFGLRRHPILGTIRMHKGVDYAAPTGTPIMAAGDARVQFIGQQRGYGNVVILNHGKGYRTLYGHMSRFGKIRAGQQINQGTVIGYVGMTGLATGPHLHYEFQVNGQHRNPLSVTMPPPEPLRGTNLIAFRTQTASALAQIQQYEKRFYAATNKHDTKSEEKSTRS